MPLSLFLLLVLGGTLSAGTLWEFFEFAIDRTGLFNAQRGLHDRLADATGAVLAASAFTTAIWVRKKKRQDCKFAVVDSSLRPVSVTKLD